jgi:Transposase IS66 family
MRIRAIYAADDAFRKLPPAQRKVMRDKHVGPLMESFFQWVREARASADGRNLATRAIGYALNQRS